MMIGRASVSYEHSYIPFLFDESTSSASVDVDLGLSRPIGRRKFGKDGVEMTEEVISILCIIF